ncbi:unnamed protein product [Pocillopora meandrina]|uniref:DUF4371 domain-containing protein n=1 Tax=Pocillopora meandrina TaxID=46732 RepID=A0AAU9XB03_9CNID|nr:unnamed protein product [Pocillopora meandrina]
MYCNRTAATESISFQANEVLTKLREDVGESKFYSILFDSTTDNTVIEQEAVIVLYFDPPPAEHHWDAQGVLAGIKRSLENTGLLHEEGFPLFPLALEGMGVVQTEGQAVVCKNLLNKNFLGSCFHGVWLIA